MNPRLKTRKKRSGSLSIFLTVFFSIVICLFGMYSAPHAKSLSPGISDIKTIEKSGPGSIRKEMGKPSRLTPSAREKLPELLITQLSLDSDCMITGMFQNRGGVIKSGSIDFKNLEIRITYPGDKKTKQVTLKTRRSGKSRQPLLLKRSSDKKDFMDGRPVKFTTKIQLQGSKSQQVLAEIDPDNKIKETKAGERQKQKRASLHPKCTETKSASNAPSFKRQSERPDVSIPAPSTFSTGNMVTKGGGSDSQSIRFFSPTQGMDIDRSGSGIPVSFGFEQQGTNFSKIVFKLYCFTKEGRMVKIITDPGWQIDNPRYSPRISFNMSLQGISQQDLHYPLYRVKVKCHPERSKPSIEGTSEAFSIQANPSTHYIKIEEVYVPAEIDAIHIKMLNIHNVSVNPTAVLRFRVRGGDTWYWTFGEILADDDPNLRRTLRFNTRHMVQVGQTFDIRITGGDSFSGVYEGAGRIRELTSFSSSGTAGTTTVFNPGSTFATIDHFEQDDGQVRDRFRVGARVVVKGSHFGTQGGRVELNWDGGREHSTRSSREPRFWTDDTIVFAIGPIDKIQKAVGFESGYNLNGRTIQLSIRPAGQTIALTRDIHIFPIANRYQPVITQHPDRIAPGQTYEIRGDYLSLAGSSGRPSVLMFVDGTSFPCPLGTRRGQGILTFQVPEDRFFPNQSVEVDVVNSESQRTQFTTRFVNEVQQGINKRVDIYLGQYKALYPSQYASSGYFVERERTVFKDMRLINGWKVVSAERVDVVKCMCAEYAGRDLPTDLCRAHIKDAPLPDSNNPETKIKIRSKKPSMSFVLHLTIKGPQGLPYFPEE